jgi:biopolymer transport protein ExbD
VVIPIEEARRQELALRGAGCANRLVVRLGEAGDWVGIEGGEARRVGKCGGEHDFVALGEALDELEQKREGCREMTLIAEPAIAYRTVIAVMDRANAAGLTDPSLGDSDQAPWLPPPEGAKLRVQAPRCAGQASNEPAPLEEYAPRGAPVLRVEPGRVAIDGGGWIVLPPGDDAIDALTAALAQRRTTWRALHPNEKWRGTIVVRASPSTRAAAVQRVLASAAAAGYADVQLAP